jgi:aspartyl-tRNA synthetase
VKLAGWVLRVRDHGGVLFVDLRDHYGVSQVVFRSETGGDLFGVACTLKPESVIMVRGKVELRLPENVNANIPTGQVEVFAEELEIDTLVQSLPFPIADDVKLPEELRLKHRFLDLRRDDLHRNIVFRAKVIREIRDFMHSEGFMEFQTPILTVSSPEGARDYLVPSRIHPGKFYALPQAPQQYKQMVMCSGFDRYFQIAPCFRDEDARADRTPGEFYQLDIEMAFATQEEVFSLLEGLFSHLGSTVTTKKVSTPFPRITYRDALNRYGSDKPDTRYGLLLKDATDIFASSAFRAFAANAKPGRCVKALVGPGMANSSRSVLDNIENQAKELGAAGLAYLVMKEGALKGPLMKYLTPAEVEQLVSRSGVGEGDCVFLCAGEWLATCKIMGQIRARLARELGMIPAGQLACCWVVDFPLFEWSDAEQKIVFSHNPFSMPQGGLEALNTQPPLDIVAYQYDLVCNGMELSSGAIRNHRPDIMYKAFEIAGYSREEVDQRFGHMIKAFTYGAPPHGGIAPGVDRLVMLLADTENIREVIMFPMNQKAQELMVGSPSEVTPSQLKELHLKVVDEDVKRPGL